MGTAMQNAVSFDPRAREGRDGRSCVANLCRQSFDPRAREGRDARVELERELADMFRSTRP